MMMILATWLQAVAIASPSNVTTGPFEVSFDLNTSKDLINQPQGPDARKVSEGLSIVSYGLEIIESKDVDIATILW